MSPPGERRIELLVLALFGSTMLSGLGLLVVYVLGGQPQIEGVLLAICLGSLGTGIVLWAQRLMVTPEVEEPRARFGPAEDTEALEEEAGFSRRRMLVLGLLGALGGLAAALAIPIFSLGPAPGRSLFETAWRPGKRLVGADGAVVSMDQLPPGSVLTVFPEDAVGSADSQTLLISVGQDLLQLEGKARDWAPAGFVAYSKVCTHAGCPVGLYREDQHVLVCPCHQSTFDVLRGAVPTFGPAARALPQLPIRLEADGTFTALGDFPEPVGPSFWDMRWDGSQR